MFRHFIGKVFLLEEPPAPEATQLTLEFTDDLLVSLDASKHKHELTRDQIIKIIAYKDEMDDILGLNVYQQMLRENTFQSLKYEKIQQIAIDINRNPLYWTELGNINSEKPTH